MPKGEPCECQFCREWRHKNLPFGSMYHSNLTQASVDALAKQNEPKGNRKARRDKRGG